MYEWDYTLHYHGPDGLHMHGMNTEELSQVRGRHVEVDRMRGLAGLSKGWTEGAALMAGICTA